MMWPPGTLAVLCTFMCVTVAGAFSCSPGLNTSGWTVPRGDVALLYGESLDLYCVLNPEHEYVKEEGYNASQIIFLRGNDRVESEYVTVINITTAHLHIPKPAMSESFYYCKLLKEKEEVVVCLNHVAVGTEPQEIEDVDCYSLNWNNLTCTWKPPHNFIKTTFYLTFRLPLRNGRILTYQCPNQTMETETGQYYCFWSMKTTPPYRQPYPTYYFNLTSTNKFGVRTKNFIFNHYAHLKSDRPMNLSVDHKTQHSCQLHWSLPHPLQNFPPGVIHRIVYRSEFEDGWHDVNTSNLELSAPNYIYNLTDLPYAYGFYNVRVYIRSEKAVLEKYWSDHANIAFRTLSKPPDRPPRVDIGNFEVATNLYNRNVTVYWEQFETFEENGDNFLYKVEVVVDGVKVNQLTTQSKKGYVLLKALPLKTLQFLLSATNAEGESADKSSLIIPAPRDLLPEPSYFTKTALGNGTYELVWKAPTVNSSRLDSYTVYWCNHSRDRPFQCEGRLKWQRIPANITTKNFTVPDSEIHQFAISANGRDTSSGMVWASCTIIPNKPVGKITDIDFSKVKSTSIEIKWKLECPDNVGVIKGYKLVYCPVVGQLNTTCREVINTVTVMNSDRNGTLQNLKPYTTYAVQVAIIAKHEVGPQSDPILTTTDDDAPDPPRDVSISELSSGSLHVFWKPPINMNGVLNFYKVHYRAHGSDWNYIKVEGNENKTNGKLSGLFSYTNYTVRVEACTRTEQKYCTLSQDILVRTAIGAPTRISKPTISNIPIDHKVTWDPPTHPGGTLDLYEVIRVIDKGDYNETESFNTTDTYLILQDKICEVEGVSGYMYMVKAINYDSAEDHGAAAFTHIERVTINKRLLDDYTVDQFAGPWSLPVDNICTVKYKYDHTIVYWAIGVVSISSFLILLIVFVKKAWIKIDKMRSIKPIMPDGLFPESEKDSKYPLGNWNPPSKHIKEHDIQYPSAPADEVSLLGSPSLAPVLSEDPPTAVGGSSRRVNSPVCLSAPYSAVGTCPSDESDAEAPPTAADKPYVTFASNPSSSLFTGDYVQAAILPSVSKEGPLITGNVALPPSYVLTAPQGLRSSVDLLQTSVLPSSYVRTAPEPVSVSTPPVAVVSPYVTLDDARFTSNVSHPSEPKKESKSGYVAHDHSMFNNAKTEFPVLEHSSLPKRVSAPPLYGTKLNSDSNKRISLSDYSAMGLDPTDPACSPEYCRFGWNSPDDVRGNHQHQMEMQEDVKPAIDIANLGKEEYELPLEDDLLSDETMESSSKAATASHYIPLNVQTLKS